MGEYHNKKQNIPFGRIYSFYSFRIDESSEKREVYLKVVLE